MCSLPDKCYKSLWWCVAKYKSGDMEGIWARRFVRPRFTFFFFFFFWPAFVDFWETNFTVMNSKFTVHVLCYTIHVLKNIKNGFHNTIYTFKNYFATVFSVFNFSNNKLNPNGPMVHVLGALTIIVRTS